MFQKTAKGRIAKTLKSFNEYCRKFRHETLSEQYATLNRKLRGHYAYFGITGNAKALNLVHHQVQKIWHKWLSRRSQKSHITWEKFNLFLKRFPLAPPRIHHQYYRGKYSKTTTVRPCHVLINCLSFRSQWFFLPIVQ